MNETTLCVGADIHQDNVVLRFVDKQTEAEVRPRLGVPNNRPGADQLIATLVQTLHNHNYTHLLLGWEATGLLWLPLASYLAQSEPLRAFAPRFLCFNPKLVHDFKQGITLQPDKTDPSDALAVAQRLQYGHLPSSYLAPPVWQALRRLTRYRFQLAHMRAAEKVRFQALTFVKVSDWTRVKPFCQVTGATSASCSPNSVLPHWSSCPAPNSSPSCASTDATTLTTRNTLPSRCSMRSPVPFRSDPELDSALTFTLATQWAHLQELQKLQKRLDRGIAHRMERIANPLLSVHGWGPVITAGILAEIADIARFPDHPQLARYAGLTWKKHASGRFTAEETALSKTGNPVLRYYFIEGADRMRQWDTEYQAFYWRKYREVPKHQHKRALVLTARKLVRLVYALLTSNHPDTRPQTKVKKAEDHRD